MCKTGYTALSCSKVLLKGFVEDGGKLSDTLYTTC